jgi:bifunctional non-homologous end joining protein LigD
LSGLFDRVDPQLRRRLRKRRFPQWCAPMLATLTDEHFSREGWIFEDKLDGERVLAFRRDGNVRLLSRNRKSCATAYPEIVDAIRAQPSRNFVVDGEVVAFDGAVSSFAKLQPRMHVRDPDDARRSGIRVCYCLFDLLYADGHDTTRLPLVERKDLLRAALRFREPLRFSAHRATHGEKFLAEACRKGLEGLIAKRADAEYAHRRSTDWLKFKCANEQEFVVGGYSDPKGARVGLGALLLGYYDRRKLRFAGEVGTGFSNEVLERLHERLSRLEQREPPFNEEGLPASGVHWVRPRLVAQVAFTEWTREGKLRHPRFKGLRRDKRPTEVVRERPS